MTDQDDPQPHVTLKDGRVMPLLGFGTQYGWSEDGQDRGRLERGAEYVARALAVGFRLIDTARCYESEAHVGRGIAASGVARRDVFVVSKAWPGVDHAPGLASSRAAVAESAARLGGYVDLYLVHHPVAGWRDLWRALEEARDTGLVRSIGVSNFGPSNFDELDAFARHAPVANQLHLHPFVAHERAATLRRCAADGVCVIGYPRSPWREGAGTAIDDVAAARGCTRAQVMLAWMVQRGHAAVPLSTDERHMRENLAAGRLGLTEAQLDSIDRVATHDVLRYHVDVLTAGEVSGWAYAGVGVAAIEVEVDGQLVGRALHGRSRPDVAAAHGGARGSHDSGFWMAFAPGCFTGGARDVVLVFTLASGRQLRTAPRRVGGLAT